MRIKLMRTKVVPTLQYHVGRPVTRHHRASERRCTTVGLYRQSTYSVPATAADTYHFPKIYRSSPQASIQNPLREGINFVTTPQLGHVELAEADVDGVLVYQGVFLATSENGFVVQRVKEGAWKSTVQGGRANLSWSS